MQVDLNSDIGESFGPFDLSMLEIGASDPPLGRHTHGPGRSRSQLSRFGRPRLAHSHHWGLFDLALQSTDR